MYKQPISTLTAISAETIFKSRCQILKYSIVLDRFIHQINTWKEQRKPTWSCFNYIIRTWVPVYIYMVPVSGLARLVKSRLALISLIKFHWVHMRDPTFPIWTAHPATPQKNVRASLISKTGLLCSHCPLVLKSVPIFPDKMGDNWV